MNFLSLAEGLAALDCAPIRLEADRRLRRPGRRRRSAEVRRRAWAGACDRARVCGASGAWKGRDRSRRCRSHGRLPCHAWPAGLLEHGGAGRAACLRAPGCMRGLSHRPGAARDGTGRTGDLRLTRVEKGT